MRAASCRSVRCAPARAATPQAPPPPPVGLQCRRRHALSLLTAFLAARPPSSAVALTMDAADGANVLNGVLGAYGLPTLKACCQLCAYVHSLTL
jgi:hypothetical protein